MRLAALLLVCFAGLNQWKVDRLLSQCDGLAPDTACYVLERKIITPQYSTCNQCCDETCESLCPATCVAYVPGPWLELTREDEPGAGVDVCFQWDTSPAGDFQGSQIPALNEIWWLNSYALDGAGNKSQPCTPQEPTP